jgi:hypothetical protein
LIAMMVIEFGLHFSSLRGSVFTGGLVNLYRVCSCISF